MADHNAEMPAHVDVWHWGNEAGTERHHGTPGECAVPTCTAERLVVERVPHIAEFDRVWRPGKSLRRVLAAYWGTEATAWVVEQSPVDRGPLHERCRHGGDHGADCGRDEIGDWWRPTTPPASPPQNTLYPSERIAPCPRSSCPPASTSTPSAGSPGTVPVAKNPPTRPAHRPGRASTGSTATRTNTPAPMECFLKASLLSERHGR